jgi:ribose 5-phosphate isomerase B
MYLNTELKNIEHSRLAVLPTQTQTLSPFFRRSVCGHDGPDVPCGFFLTILHEGERAMKIALASDHAGFTEKERLKPLLSEIGIEFEDLGTSSEESVDYPDYAQKVAEQVAAGRVEQGLLVCGSGIGMAISANKVNGVRAALAWSEETARLARQHNDANVLAIGARTTLPGEIPKIIKAWFETDFEGGRHSMRVEKINAIERR